MSTEKAKRYFTKTENGKKLNCAQAVIKAFKDKFAPEDLSVEDFSRCGGGGAPEGECGALYAAERLLKGKAEDAPGCLREDFSKKAGSVKCKKIRKKGELSCLGCVETASKHLEREKPDKQRKRNK